MSHSGGRKITAASVAKLRSKLFDPVGESYRFARSWEAFMRMMGKLGIDVDLVDGPRREPWVVAGEVRPLKAFDTIGAAEDLSLWNFDYRAGRTFSQSATALMSSILGGYDWNSVAIQRVFLSLTRNPSIAIMIPFAEILLSIDMVLMFSAVGTIFKLYRTDMPRLKRTRPQDSFVSIDVPEGSHLGKRNKTSESVYSRIGGAMAGTAMDYIVGIVYKIVVGDAEHFVFGFLYPFCVDSVIYHGVVCIIHTTNILPIYVFAKDTVTMRIFIRQYFMSLYPIKNSIQIESSTNRQCSNSEFSDILDGYKNRVRRDGPTFLKGGVESFAVSCQVAVLPLLSMTNPPDGFSMFDVIPDTHIVAGKYVKIDKIELDVSRDDEKLLGGKRARDEPRDEAIKRSASLAEVEVPAPATPVVVPMSQEEAGDESDDGGVDSILTDLYEDKREHAHHHTHDVEMPFAYAEQPRVEDAPFVFAEPQPQAYVEPISMHAVCNQETLVELPPTHMPMPTDNNYFAMDMSFAAPAAPLQPSDMEEVAMHTSNPDVSAVIPAFYPTNGAAGGLVSNQAFPDYHHDTMDSDLILVSSKRLLDLHRDFSEWTERGKSLMFELQCLSGAVAPPQTRVYEKVGTLSSMFESSF